MTKKNHDRNLSEQDPSPGSNMGILVGVRERKKMGDYRAQSLSQRKKSIVKDWDKAAMCLSDGELAWHADIAGLRPRIQGGRGHSILRFFHRKEGKPGSHGTQPWVRLQPDEG